MSEPRLTQWGPPGRGYHAAPQSARRLAQSMNPMTNLGAASPVLCVRVQSRYGVGRLHLSEHFFRLK